MSTGLSPLRTLPEFIELFHSFKAHTFLGVIKVALVGALLTAVVQSSAATLGITITLAVQGLIDYPTAVALVLGENVGTTVTALFASIGANSNAKRAAYAHTLINIVGVMWATVLFKPYLKLLENFSDPTVNMSTAIATAHTIFNIVNVILFIPFVGYLAKFLCKIVKDDDNGIVRVTRLSSLMVTLPSVIISQTKTEVLAMASNIKEVFFKLEELYYDDSKLEAYCEEINNIEYKLDLYEKEVSDANFSILNKGLQASYVEETRGNLITCDEYETISDYLARVSNGLRRLKSDDIHLTDIKKETLQKLNSMVFDFFDDINKAYDTNNKELFIVSIKKYTAIKNLYKEARNEHFANEATNNDIMPSKLSTGYMDILNYYRRATDHIYNIIEHFAKI